MKFLRIIPSQIVYDIFLKNGDKTLLSFTNVDKKPIDIGYRMIDENLFCIDYLAIQIENSPTYEMFELFDMDLMEVKTIDDVKIVASSVADNIVKYNKALLKYYSKKE